MKSTVISIKSTIMVLIAIFGLISCDQTLERTFYNDDGKEGYSFSQKVMTAEFVIEDNNIYSVPLYRKNASGAASVDLKLTDSKGLFSLVSSTASFEAGKYETTVSFKYNMKNLLPSTQYDIKLQIPSGKTSHGSDSILTVQGKVNVPLTWKKAGSGIFSSEWYEEEWAQDLYQSNEFDAVYMLQDCYYKNYNLQFILNANNSITYANQPMGERHPTYGMINWSMPAASAAKQPHKDGKTYYFAPRFIVSAGSFGQGEETFELNE